VKAAGRIKLLSENAFAHSGKKDHGRYR
jgi:hypothetical protein